jgi:uncharacterized protein YbaR (Trm112 family)
MPAKRQFGNMAAESSSLRQASIFDERVLEQLACPVCLGGLRVARDAIVCAGCGRAYPLIDGIAVLIAERAALDFENTLN